jgi:hypothetical protein
MPICRRTKFSCEFWTFCSFRNKKSDKQSLCVVRRDAAVFPSTIDTPEVLGDAEKGKRKNIQQAGFPDGHPL